MDMTLAIEPHDTLLVILRDGPQETTVRVRPASAGARSLADALARAVVDGYGECFWPGAIGGQYWWAFKRDDGALETMAMWTRGGASLWEHVFRATDSVEWVRSRLAAETERLGLANHT